MLISADELDLAEKIANEDKEDSELVITDGYVL